MVGGASTDVTLNLTDSQVPRKYRASVGGRRPDLQGMRAVAVLSVFVVWLFLFKTTRYVSVASIGAAVSLPIFVLLYLNFKMLTGPSLLPFSILIAAVVIWRHRSNMQRLFQGKEQRFDQE